VALVISGAAALGPYEGGAVYEILSALTQSRRRGMGQPPLIPDALIGTSAGALTAALAAHCLVNGAPLETIHDAWVKGASAARLSGSARGRRRSVLSGAAMGALVRDWLRPTAPGAVPMADWPLRFVATLTNLDGIRYRFGTSGDPPTVETVTHEDFKVYDLDPRRPYDEAVWSGIARAAAASAAFPVGFEPVRVDHGRDELDRSVPGRHLDDGRRQFWCTDGGVLEGMPLGRAIDAVADLDSPGAADPAGAASPVANSGVTREFIVIEPGDPGDQSAGPPGPDGYSPVAVLSKLATIPISEQISRDLTRFEKTNQRLTALAEAWDDWAAVIARLGEPEALAALADLSARTRRLWPDLDGVVDGLAGEQDAGGWPLSLSARSPAHRRLFLLLRLRLEGAAGLFGKRRYQLHHLSPEQAADLAGGFWGHFGGLFDERFREHDFRVGRRVARDWLRRRGIEYEPGPEADYEVVALHPRGWPDLSWSGRWQSLKVAGNAVDLVLDQLSGAGWAAILGGSAVAAYRGLTFPLRRVAAVKTFRRAPGPTKDS
jgi:predicted acylesterase/phospholipase RssA